MFIHFTEKIIQEGNNGGKMNHPSPYASIIKEMAKYKHKLQKQGIIANLKRTQKGKHSVILLNIKICFKWNTFFKLYFHFTYRTIQ